MFEIRGTFKDGREEVLAVEDTIDEAKLTAFEFLMDSREEFSIVIVQVEKQNAA
jgi:hypothetical protein